jgi:hypothetical protein
MNLSFAFGAGVAPVPNANKAIFFSIFRETASGRAFSPKYNGLT